MPQPELDPATYGFSEADLDRPIFLDKVLGLEQATIRQIVEILKRTYCHTLGVEFMHISDPEQKAWIQERIEGADKEISFTPEGKKAILAKLIEAEGFENFLNVKYTGTKRFGLDGGESDDPGARADHQARRPARPQEIVLGMAHRGRLNVLANVMSKPFSAIFHEFKGGSSTPDEVEGSGDVKYHLGSSSDREFDGNTVHLSLTANPSHLEIVDPVVLGKARAKQDQRGDKERTSVLPLLIHGDAAFAGQGVVAECFGLSGLRGHRSGGSIHFIVNNQIGFTTSPLVGALFALSIRRRQDDRGADLPCQWRRSGSGGLRRQDRHRVPPEVQEAGGHRHVLLPPLRPQRNRRAVLHPALDVQGDRRPRDRGDALWPSG